MRILFFLFSGLFFSLGARAQQGQDCTALEKEIAQHHEANRKNWLMRKKMQQQVNALQQGKSPAALPQNIASLLEHNTKLAWKLHYENEAFFTYLVSPKSWKVSLHYKDGAGKKWTQERLKKHYPKGQLFMLMNAGPFDVHKKPLGFCKIKGSVLSPINTATEGTGNFFALQPNGILFFDAKGKAGILSTETYLKVRPKAHQAVQAGPMLLIEGKVHPTFQKNSINKSIRSGVGLLPNGKLIFAVSEGEVNFYSFAMLFKTVFGCENALTLGGGAFNAYIPELQKDSANDFIEGGVILTISTP